MSSGRPSVLLQGLAGLPIWSATLGTGSQPSLSLELGEERRRGARLANPELSFLKRTFEGSHTLLLEGPWRLDRGPKPLISQRTPGPFGEGRELSGLVGTHVAAAREDGPDLILELAEGLVLRSFTLNLGPRDASWSLSTPEGILSSVGGRVELAERVRPKPRLTALSDEVDEPIVAEWTQRRGAEAPRGRGSEDPRGRGSEDPRGRGSEDPRGRGTGQEPPGEDAPPEGKDPRGEGQEPPADAAPATNLLTLRKGPPPEDPEPPPAGSRGAKKKATSRPRRR